MNQEVRPDPKAESWGSKNKWFGSDKAMTYTAFDIHRKLVDEEGYDASSDEYYTEIDKRIRLEFPHKFDKIATYGNDQTDTSSSFSEAKCKNQVAKL
jgi:GH15 family glucan-1,4-alpha-glucosidase